MIKHFMIYLSLAASASLTLAGGDIEAGKARAATCIACHGPAGISMSPDWPNLAGQKEGYLLKQLQAFKNGSRTSPLMGPMAAPLSEQDMANLAAYYSSL